MSTGPVPPRPDLPSSGAPWGAPAPRASVPGWRRATLGRIVLHVVLGAAIAFGLLVAMLVVVFAAGRSPDQFDAADQRAQAMLGGAFWLLLLGGEAAWLLFVYLRGSTALRTIVFVVVGGIAFWVAVALGLSALPRIG